MPFFATPTVWIVDDDEDDQLFIRSAFQEESPSIQVLCLRDGEELLSILAKCAELPLLILLDINMPRKDGFETLQELRSVATYAQLPVVMLTTSSEPEDIQRCISLGANHFLTKPLTYEQLRDMVQALRKNWELT
ncbi:response regulator [Spirosoma sp. HMF4905]|uniref:Response regulator n=1 Tax=Spirosoma arboris TaxID=2682092 RepID=A0A7K1SP84_9BACT|nr:response regulator [Spirosoma arboris]MVM35622.1 response regulator [Spirosoma arboris]